MWDDLDLKLGVELLGVLVALVTLIIRLHQKNVERLHDLHLKSASNGEQLTTIRKQLDHQDQCIDELKREAVAAARGGTDLARRADIESELSRIRQAISVEITRTIGNFDTRVEELRERLRALEARAMRNTRGDE